MTLPMNAFDGPIWRLVAKATANTPAVPASAPEGRFHRSGQIAVYGSLSAEGAIVAIQRYLNDEVARVLIPMRLTANRVADARGLASASVVWQNLKSAGHPSPTWAVSDAARQANADAMLYSSRSWPELSHIVIFKSECLHSFGEPSEFLAD